MFPGHSPRRLQGVAGVGGIPGVGGVAGVGGGAGYPASYLAYQQAASQQPYDIHPSYSMYGMDQQWAHHPYLPTHLYNRSYEEWGSSHHGFQPPSPGHAPSPNQTGHASSEHEEGSHAFPEGENRNHAFTEHFKSSLISGDFKPPLFLESSRAGDDISRSEQDGSTRNTGHSHHSPDSGLAVSDGPGSPGHAPPHQPGLGGDPGSPGVDPLPARPQPARSPYEWMKRPSINGRPCKEGTSSPDGRTRTKDKYRVVYSDHQRLELEKEFHYSRYITIRRKAELAQALSLTERQVKIWFQNRRAKERKQVKKRDEMIHKDKLDPLSVHPSHMVAMQQFSMGPMGHMLHGISHL